MRKLILFMLLIGVSFGAHAQDARLAYKSFNENYLNPDKHIYQVYPSSNQIAAIWTQAIFWDMSMENYLLKPDSTAKKLIEQLYVGNYKQYDGFNWNNTSVWFIYDDIMWWVISFARAYEITKDEKYLAHAILGFDRVWSGTPKVDDQGSYDSKLGGMYWGWKSDQRGKTACINYPTIIAAMLLYKATQNKDYLKKADEVYSWARSALFDSKTGKVADHQVPGHPTNWTVNLYNQATCLGAATLLYEESKKQEYLKDAKLAADYVMRTMSDKEGILPHKNGIEQGIYSTIFAQYIQMLFKYDSSENLKKWLKKNVDLAWKNRDKRGLMDKDFHKKADDKTEVYDASGAVALLQILNK